MVPRDYVLAAGGGHSVDYYFYITQGLFPIPDLGMWNVSVGVGHDGEHVGVGASDGEHSRGGLDD